MTYPRQHFVIPAGWRGRFILWALRRYLGRRWRFQLRGRGLIEQKARAFLLRRFASEDAAYAAWRHVGASPYVTDGARRAHMLADPRAAFRYGPPVAACKRWAVYLVPRPCAVAADRAYRVRMEREAEAYRTRFLKRA